jgi:hypothetical protein
MNNNNLFKSLMASMICLSLLTGISNAQDSSEPGAIGASTQSGQTTLISPSEDETDGSKFSEADDDEDSTQGQAIVLNSKYAGWEEATGVGDGGDRVGKRLRGNWIMVDANGRFDGKVVAGAGADVTNMNVFLMNMGRLVKQTTLNSNGQFEFNNVRQGAYSLIGWGDKGFFAFGMNVLANNPNVQAGQNSIRVTAFQNATTINTDWIQYYASRINYRVFGRYLVGEGRDDPAKLYGFMGLVRNMPKSIPATSISSHTVSKTADGRLIGRVHQVNSLSGRPVDVRTTKVMLLQGDNVVATTTTDNYGAFEFLQVPDGSYGLVAAGVDGVGLIAINVGSSGAMNDLGQIVGGSAPIDFAMVSTETIGWLNHYASEVAYRRALLAPRPPAAPENQLAGYGCQTCGNQAGGCATCQQNYNQSYCRSRGITFEQWQQMGCSCNGQGLGDGKIIADITRKLRENTKRVDAAFERAFYPNEFNNQQYNNYGGYNNGLNQPYYGN